MTSKFLLLSTVSPDTKAAIKCHTEYGNLLQVLSAKELQPDVVAKINEYTAELNAHSNTKGFYALLSKKKAQVLALILKHHKIVPKGYYRTLWMLLGMTSFGLPIGAGIGMAIGNIGLLGAGLPIGMGIGMVVGERLDSKAAARGLQIDIAPNQ